MNKIKWRSGFEYLVRIIIVITLLLTYYKPQMVQAGTTPDSISVELQSIPSVLLADLTSSQVLPPPQGVMGQVTLQNPFHKLFMSFSHTQTSANNFIPDISPKNSLWDSLGLIPPGDTLTYQVRFSDMSESIMITGKTDDKAIAATVLLFVFEKLPGVEGKSTVEIFNAIGDITEILNMLKDYGDPIYQFTEILGDPLNIKTPERLASVAKGLHDFFTSDRGINFVVSVLTKLKVSSLNVEIVKQILSKYALYLEIAKYVSDGLVNVGISVFWNHSFVYNINILPKLYGPGIPPVAPVLKSPLGTDAPNPPTLVWNKVLRASIYIVDVDTSPDFTNPLFHQLTANTSITVDRTLSSNASYYWRVKARSDYGNESQANIGTFRIGGIIYPVTLPPTVDDQAAFVADITLPDGLLVSPSQSLNKIWLVKNTGTTTWGAGYQLAFVSGEQMGAPATTNVPSTTPGATVNLSINIASPSAAGLHTGYFQLRNPQGTYFGPKIYVKINVAVPSGKITILTADPASPANTTRVRFHVKADKIDNFRSMRILIDGTQRYEQATPEYYWDWDTTAYSTGAHSIVVEAANASDTGWNRPYRQGMTYMLQGVTTPVNHQPNPSRPSSPYDWYVYYSGSTATLCAQAQGDPDNDAISSYYFEIHDSGQSWNSGWTGNSCVTTTSLAAYTYTWHVRVRDSRGAISDYGPDAHFTIVNQNLSITSFTLTPLDGKSENVRLKACVTGQGGVAITIRFLVNSATDGSASGTWRNVGELGVPCFTDVDAPIWHTLEDNTLYGDGQHLVRVEAHGASTGWNGAVAQDQVYTLPHRRPSDSRLKAPIPASLNIREAIYVNTRSIPFSWNASDRATSYRLSVDINPSPKDNPNPVFRQTYSGSTLQATATLSQDYSALYWQVEAINDIGINSSGDQLIGIDRTPPTCAIQPLPSITYDNVFQVTWGGTDNLSGIASYRIQYQDTSRGDWVDWLASVPASKTYELFSGQPGHSYTFQCLAVDNATNQGTYSPASNAIKVDPTARPSEPWWNSAYQNKRNLTILNNMGATTLPAGYPVHLRFDSGTSPSAAEIYNASLSANKCDDVRIVYNNTTEVSRVIRSCSSSAIDFWFRTQTAIAAGLTSTMHQIYYGNANPGTPPANVGDVYYPSRDSNTVGLWYMAEGQGSTAYDSSGNSLNCSLDATTTWTTFNKFPGVLHFLSGSDGPTAYCGTSGLYNLQNFTFELYFRSTQNNLWGRMAGNIQPTSQRWILEGLENRPSAWIWTTNGDYRLTALRTYTDNQWHHLAFTVSGTQIQMFIDGQWVTSGTMPGSIRSASLPFTIGSAENINRTFAEITGVRLSNIARTDFSYGAFVNITNEPTVAAGGTIAPPINGTVDLAIQSLNVYPNVGGGVLIEAVVTNQGTLSTTNGFYTDLYLNHQPTGSGDLTGSLRFWVNDPIPAGATAHLTTVVTDLSALGGLAAPGLSAMAPGVEQSGTLYAQTDSVGSLRETTKTNNITALGTEICVASADAYSGDDTAAGASTLQPDTTYGGWLQQHHNLNRLSDMDWVKFTPVAGITYTFRTLNLSPSADTYLYLYDTNGTTLLDANDDDNSSLSSRIEWTAPTSGTYYLLVRGWNPNVAGCGTGYDLEGRPKVSPPILSRPLNGSVLAANTNVTLSWQAKTGRGHAYYAELTGPSNITNSGWIGANTWNVGVLTPGAYSWRVKTKTTDEFDESDWSETWTFSIGNVPGIFQKSGPSNLASGVSITPILKWGSSSGATSYEYCYYPANESGCTNWWIVGTATSITADPLNTSTTYFWQVRARNADGVTEATGGWWSFTTESCTGCSLSNSAWPMFRQNTRHTGQSSTDGPASKPVIHWEYNAEAYEGGAAAIGPDGTVYVGLHYSMFAFSSDGVLKWSFPGGGQVRAPAVTSDGTVYFGSSDGKVYAVRSDGSLKWSYITGSWIAASPTIAADGTIYIGSSDGYFYAITPQGGLKWRYEVGSWINSSAALDSSGNIYFGSTTSWIYSLTPQGSLRWSYQTGTYVDSSPAIANDGTVYIGSIDEKLYALNQDGSLKWSYSTGGAIVSSPAIAADGTVYFGSMDNHFYALNPNGTLKWRYLTGDVVNSSAAIGQNGTVYMASQDGSLYSLSPQGNLNWEYFLGGESQGPVLSSSGTIYLNENGRVYAFRPELKYHNYLPEVMR